MSTKKTVSTKKIFKKSVSAKKAAKKISKKSTQKKESPLNSKAALADLKKDYDKLTKLNAERAVILDAIARKEAALGEVLDMNLAKFDEGLIGLTIGSSRTPETPSPFPGVSIPTTDNGLPPNAVAYRFG